MKSICQVHIFHFEQTIFVRCDLKHTPFDGNVAWCMLEAVAYN